MKYRIEKPEDDARAFSHGIVLPDGFYRVVELTRYNGKALEGMESRGYLVTELEDEDKTVPGLYYAATGQRVTDESALGVMDKDSGIGELEPAGPGYVDPAKMVGMPRKERVKRGILKVSAKDAEQGRRIQRESLAAQVEEAAVKNRLSKGK